MAKNAPPKPNDAAAVAAASKTPETEAKAEQDKAAAKEHKAKVKLLSSLNKRDLTDALARNVTVSEARAMQSAALGI